MSYQSRVYRQRNPVVPEEGKKEAFFTKSENKKPGQKKNAFFQAKLEVNAPGDSFEKEADSVAGAVVDRSSRKPIAQQQSISSVQRLATTHEEEVVSSNDERMERDKEKPYQKKEEDPEKEKKVHRKEDPMKEKEEKKHSAAVQKKQDGSQSAAATPAVSSKIENSAGKGKPMPGKTMGDMNRSFGRDFRDVKLHTDHESESLNQDLQAKAFTHGKDIYFGRGNYNPESREGRFLLAHELTHVVQQNGPEIKRDPGPPLAKFDFPVKSQSFDNFDGAYAPDDMKPGEGTFTVTHNIKILFGDKIDKTKQEKFRSDFKTNVESIWSDKFVFELNDPGFTPYKAHIKLDVEFVDDPKKANTFMEVKDRDPKFRSNVESRTSDKFPSLHHVAHLDTGDPSPDLLAKKHKGKTLIEPTLDQHVGNFEFDSAEINEDCKKGIDIIEKHIDTIKDESSDDEPSFSARIDYIGRASPEGNKWYNVQLSKKRALAVKKQIESDKPAAKKLAANLTAEGADKTQNEAIKENYRRVNVLIYPFTLFSKAKDVDQNTAAHEFGHMIGYGDEYDDPGSKVSEKKIAGDMPSHYEDVKSIMGQAAADELTMKQSSSVMSAGNELKKGHYAYFLKALRDLTGKQGWNVK